MMAATTAALTTVVPSTGTQLDYLISSARACIVQPYAFFVSWQGVLTLAYAGFPPSLVALKEHISEFYAVHGENPGSRWPKTSLGALKEGKRLTPDQLATLIAICKEESEAFGAEDKQCRVLVDKLAVVVYECRCLERQLVKHVVAMAGPVDDALPSAEEKERVRGIVAEADSENYWFHASRDGSREGHYSGNALGVTLVHELEAFRPGASPQSAQNAQLPGHISRFRLRVDAALPGMYRWFADDSLHITIRGIIG